MSTEIDSAVCSFVNNLIPIVKKRVLRSLDRSREDVEFELATLANLLVIQEHLQCR